MEWLIVAGVVVVLALVVARRKAAKRRTEALRRRFGPEYERLLTELGDRKAAEAQLQEWTQRRAAVELHDLSPDVCKDYSARWRENQATFVDGPEECLKQAEALLDELARERGYPVDDPAAHAELLSVDHPRLVERYRVAQSIHLRSVDGVATIDELRIAFRNYRSLFNELLVEGGGPLVRYEQDVR